MSFAPSGAQPDEHPARVERDVGHFRSKLDQRHSEVALVLAEAGQRRGDGRGHDRLHPEMRGTDDIVDVAQRRRVGGDYVDVHAQPVGMEPDRMLDALHSVDGVERRMGVERDLPVAVDRILPARQKLVDVRLLDLVPAQLDFDIGDVAGEPAGAEARPYVLDRHARHALGELDGLADGMLARFHVGDVAALDAAPLALAGAEHLQAPVVPNHADQRPDLRRADVERCNQRLIDGRGHGEDANPPLARSWVAPA
jgi:hypothetical protein